MYKYIISCLLIFGCLSANAQVESEVGFLYVKAEYLLETQRYDEAVTAFTEVIRMQQDYEDALLKRASAKYAMAAYRGVKDDVINSIKLKGVSPEAAKLLGLVDYRQKNYEAAINSLNLAGASGSNDQEIYYIMGECYLAIDEFANACGSWQEAAKLGSNKAQMQSNKYCNEVVSNKPNSGPRPRPNSGGKPTTTKPGRTGGSTTTTGNSGGVTKPDLSKPGTKPSSGSGQEVDEIIVVDEEPSMPVDNSVNEIFVDEDLTIFMQNGIGSRDVLKQPNILILAEDSGSVAIDVVINERGRVQDAVFNPGASTMDTRSIVTLATRKAGEFWFEKSDWEKMEGTIVFKISGR